MNERVAALGEARVADPAAPEPRPGAETGVPPETREAPPRHRGARRAGLAALGMLLAALGYGVARHAAQDHDVAAAAERQREFVPSLRAETVQPAGAVMIVTLPATTSAFEAANVFARASGYIATRAVDIGDHVTDGQMLAQITAPELDHQIAQAQATLAQNEATLRQVYATRDLAAVTNTRTTKLVVANAASRQQGDNDRLSLQAQQAAVGVAEANVNAQHAQLQVLQQQKVYQKVVAPFDGVITQRNIDVGSLVQADATSGTFMFAVMRSNVVRIQLYVPQSEAFGLAAGVDAVFRVPEIPNRTFPGTVTRTAIALQPGTRTLLTEIDVPNPDETLSPGTYGTVELHIPRKTEAVLVSADAIIFNSAGIQVAVVENGTAHLRKIAIARDLGRDVEVSAGVRSGDRVIVNPPVDLADGAKVSIRQDPAAQSS